MQLCRIIYYSLVALHVLCDIFAHHQEHLNCITSSGITHVCRCQLAATYVCNTRSCNTVQLLLMMSENIAQNMQSNQGIINYPTQLHLVGHFFILFHDARKRKYHVLTFYVIYISKNTSLTITTISCRNMQQAMLFIKRQKYISIYAFFGFNSHNASQKILTFGHTILTF